MEYIQFDTALRIAGAIREASKEKIYQELGLEPAQSRSSRPEMFCKKGVPENFAKFTGKHLCQSLFFNKVASLRPATLIKRDSGADVFL